MIENSPKNIETAFGVHTLEGGKRILVINHRSNTGFKNLIQALTEINKKPVSSLDYEDVDQVETSNIDLIVLAGGNTFPVAQNQKLLTKEIELVRKANVPVLGICYGYQVIASAFNCKLEKLSITRKGNFPVTLVRQDKIFEGIHNFTFWENHKWAVVDTGSNVEVLARSDFGIEAIKIRGRKIYGLQFHPEAPTSVNEQSARILENFIKMVE